VCNHPQAVYQCEDESLWVWEDALLVLDLGLDIVNRVQGLDLRSNCLTHKCFNEDLHATMKTEDKVESQLLLNVIVQQGATVLKLLASKDEALLIAVFYSPPQVSMESLWSLFLLLPIQFIVLKGQSLSYTSKLKGG